MKLFLLFAVFNAAIAQVPPIETLKCDARNPFVLNNLTVVGNGSIGSITAVALQAALDIAGHILLNQGMIVSEIIIVQTLMVTKNTIIYGGGLYVHEVS